jgi:hypothetical protein
MVCDLWAAVTKLLAPLEIGARDRAFTCGGRALASLESAPHALRKAAPPVSLP